MSRSSANGPARAFFDLWSRAYDNPFVQAVTYRPIHDAVVHALLARRPRSVADIGCGTGLLTVRLADQLGAGVVIGADYSNGMLAHAARRSDVPRWVQSDAMALPFADGAVEAVVCTDSFHWYPDQERALREFGRVLFPGGRAYVACINAATPAVAAVIAAWSRVAGQPLYWPTRAEMRRMSHEAGLRVVKQRPILRLPMTTYLPPVLNILERPQCWEAEEPTAAGFVLFAGELTVPGGQRDRGTCAPGPVRHFP